MANKDKNDNVEHKKKMVKKKAHGLIFQKKLLDLI